MVKLHLPHMYMFLLIISKEKIIRIYSTMPSNFSILLGSYATFSSPSRRILWVCSNFIKDTICFFCGFDRGASRVFCSFSPIRYYFQLPENYVPPPMMAVELNQIYLKIPKAYSDIFFVCKSIVNTFTTVF